MNKNKLCRSILDSGNNSFQEDDLVTLISMPEEVLEKILPDENVSSEKPLIMPTINFGNMEKANVITCDEDVEDYAKLDANFEEPLVMPTINFNGR